MELKDHQSIVPSELQRLEQHQQQEQHQQEQQEESEQIEQLQEHQHQQYDSAASSDSENEASSIRMDRIVVKEVKIEGVITSFIFKPRRKANLKFSPTQVLPQLNRYNRKWYENPSKFHVCTYPTCTALHNKISRVIHIENESGLLNFCVEFLPVKQKRNLEITSTPQN